MLRTLVAVMMRFGLYGLALSIHLFSALAMAQTVPGAPPGTPAVGALRVVPGERLSDWLLRNADSKTDLTALHWTVVTEQPAQAQLRHAVVAKLGERAALAQWLSRLPVTGRVVVAYPDARWLQGAVKDDPVLGTGQSVVLLHRPEKVSVLNEKGLVCLVVHRAGALAGDYLQACAADFSGDARDSTPHWAWLAQADGRVAPVGVASWNAQAQDEPGPGAWLWAPSNTAGVSGATSSNLARFLATQLPAEVLLPALGLDYRQTELPAIPASGDLRGAARDLELTASDWGEIGLLQTPTARMERVGEVRLKVSSAWPYTNLNVMLQPMEWLEAGFRYTDVQTALYGPEIAGGQTYKDKSFDLKIRLLEESAKQPQLAAGLRDIGGTGLFSGEYVVASKRWGDWDASAGLGWGYLGGRANIRAPFGFLGDGFKNRPQAEVGQGGVVSTNPMFRGNAALFGGVQWHVPRSSVILKLELDGNNYQNEPFSSQLQAPSPLNIGAVYRYSPFVDFSGSWERGNRLSFGITLHAALDKLESPKMLDPAPPRVQALPVEDLLQTPLTQSFWGEAAQELRKHTGWQVIELLLQRSILTVRAETDESLFIQERVQAAVAVLHKEAPWFVKQFVFELQRRGLSVTTVEVDRAQWVAQRTQAQPSTMRHPVQRVLVGAPPEVVAREAQLLHNPAASDLSIQWGPSYRQILGGPDGFLLYQAGLQGKLDWRLSPGTWLTADLNARLLDNYQGFKYDAPSNLPRVRTFAREYVTTSQVTMPVLQLTHVQDMGAGHYASVYGGMLEDMYAGVGGEWLYRPWQGPLAFGVDVNRVRQRDFRQNLVLRDYQVNTGHATLYWDTGVRDVQIKLSAGQYLAGDTGATLDLRRVFRNGTAIGAWVTKTNVSAEQFGEGSFDKGVYITIPFDVMLPKSSPGVANIAWTPLTRDGGARLGRSVSLFDLTSQRDARLWGFNSKPVSGARRLVSAEHLGAVELEPAPDPW